jgi:glucokinase
MYDKFILVGDIGGTNTTLAVFGVKKFNALDLIYKKKYSSQLSKDLHLLINEILSFVNNEFRIHISDACFDTAGPVTNNRTFCELTNLPWNININDLYSKTLLSNILFLNDFEAIGFGIPLLDKMDHSKVEILYHANVNVQKVVNTQTKAVVGAGTGLGVSILSFDKEKGKYFPIASEGGHNSLCAKDELEWGLIKYLKKNITNNFHPDWESVLSGRGMSNIYNYLRSINYMNENSEVTSKIDDLDDSLKPAVIDKFCSHSPTCEQTVSMFIDFYARRAQALALTSLSYGGLYLAGGMVIRMLDFFRKPHFIETFFKNYKKSEILRKIPVYVVKDYDVNLVGCSNALLHFRNDLVY